jgi:hypothetical protein
MSDHTEQDQGKLFEEVHAQPFDVERYAGYIAEHASRVDLPDRDGVHQDVTGVKPGAERVTIHGPGSPDWEEMRSRVG